ncbi:MAG: fatty acid desaturase [Alphaproteobacteria bacterium]|nr:fatty acid desaturase [Alphaproteobacteria bacterium]
MPPPLESVLRDPRDRPLLVQVLKSSVLLPSAVAVFVAAQLGPWPFAVAAAVHLTAYLVHLEAFITLFHDVNHHPLFHRRYAWANAWLVWVYGVSFGCTPHTYHAHHVLMHHPANNLEGDASSTLPYQRDSIRDFIRYYLRFFVSLGAVREYLATHFPRKRALRLRLLGGEFGYWAVVALLAAWSPLATLVTLIFPVWLTRSLLIVGNWGEHAFVDPAAPEDPYRNSTDLIGSTFNDRAFNVGYHIGHHLRPSAHFSTQPEWFARNVRTYGERDAVVFRDLHYPHVWWWLMTGRYDRLADHFVQLPGAPVRSRDQVVAMLRSRVVPITLRAT